MNKKRLAAMVKKLLKKMEDRLAEGTANPTVTEYIRLVQLHKELQEQEKPKLIRVLWVEPQDTEPSTSE